MSGSDATIGAVSPAVIDAPRLARRLADWRALALEMGFDDVLLRGLRTHTVSVVVDGEGPPSVRRDAVRALAVTVTSAGRTVSLDTTDLQGDAFVHRLEALRTFLAEGAPELFAPASRARRLPPPRSDCSSCDGIATSTSVRARADEMFAGGGAMLCWSSPQSSKARYA